MCSLGTWWGILYIPFYADFYVTVLMYVLLRVFFTSKNSFLIGILVMCTVTILVTIYLKFLRYLRIRFQTHHCLAWTAFQAPRIHTDYLGVDKEASSVISNTGFNITLWNYATYIGTPGSIHYKNRHVPIISLHCQDSFNFRIYSMYRYTPWFRPPHAARIRFFSLPRSLLDMILLVPWSCSTKGCT